MRELRRDTSRRNEEASSLIQGPSEPRGDSFDTEPLRVLQTGQWNRGANQKT